MESISPTVAVVEEEQNKALHDWVVKTTTARVLKATAKNLAQLSSEKIDLVLLDVNMPRASGIEILKALEEASTRHLRVVVLWPPGPGTPARKTGTGSPLQSWLNELLERVTSEKEPSPTPGYPQGDWRSVAIPEIAKDLGVSRAALAQILGTNERNLARWVHGESRPKGSREAALQRIRYIHALLIRAFKREVIPRYLREANPGFGGRTPLLALQSQDFRVVEANLLQIVEGVYV